MRLRRYMETAKKDNMMNLKTIKFDKESHRTMYSQIEEGEDLVQVVEDDLLDKENLKEL